MSHKFRFFFFFFSEILNKIMKKRNICILEDWHFINPTLLASDNHGVLNCGFLTSSCTQESGENPHWKPGLLLLGGWQQISSVWYSAFHLLTFQLPHGLPLSHFRNDTTTNLSHVLRLLFSVSLLWNLLWDLKPVHKRLDPPLLLVRSWCFLTAKCFSSTSVLI